MTHHDLTQGSEAQQLMRMIVPILLGILSIMLMNVIDTYFVAQLGTQALAAMSFTIPITSIINSLAFGVGIGASSLISRALGSGRTDLVRSYCTLSLLFALVLAILFAMVGIRSIDPLFTLMGADAATLPLIHDYMHTWYLGCFFIVVPMVGNACIRASGNAILPTGIMLMAAILICVLDPIFIFGLWGFPAMGLQGAALATICAYALCLCVSFYILQVKLKFFHLPQLLATSGAQTRQYLLDLLRMFIPAAGSNLLSPLSISLTTWLVADYGSAAVAGFGAAARIEALCLITPMACASAMAAFSGQNFGAGRIDRLANALRFSFRFAWAWGIVAALLLLLLAPRLARLFTQDAAAQQAIIDYLCFVPLSYPLLGMIMAVTNMGNGMGKPVGGLLLSSLRLILVYLPLAWLLGKFGGLPGIFFASAAANVIVGLIAWWWSKKLLIT